MKFDVITLFPEMFDTMNHSIVGRAINKKIIQLKCWNPRDYTKDKHRRVDDRPYGGGPGMVILAPPLRDTICEIKRSNKTSSAKVIYLTPQGKLLTQSKIKKLSNQKHLILISGHYEGVDERIKTEIDEELSIGDYVLSGGELAAMVLIDSITRLLPGALGDENSAKKDSFMQGLLDYPNFTRPKEFNRQIVPNVLLNGNHKQIALWRLKQSLGRTYLRRPNLLKKYKLTANEQKLLIEFINEQKIEETHE